jgi:hypothetical protein
MFVKELWRYPVKSLAGERIREAGALRGEELKLLKLLSRRNAQRVLFEYKNRSPFSLVNPLVVIS